MTAKEKAIREAWGDKFEELKNYIDENGWCSLDYNRTYTITGLPLDQKAVHISFRSVPEYWTRPKSLEGIENNNGWTVIQSDDWLKSVEIDKSTTQYYVHDPNEDYISIVVRVEIDNEVDYLLLSDFLYVTKSLTLCQIKATHYQPIIKPKPPIY